MSEIEQQRWSRIDGDGNTRVDPSPAQAQLWAGRYDGEPDPHGWYNGWCPIHDPDGEDLLLPTAQWNFLAGAMRCLKDPPCHPKRSISLTNLLALMARGGE